MTPRPVETDDRRRHLHNARSEMSLERAILEDGLMPVNEPFAVPPKKQASK